MRGHSDDWYKLYQYTVLHEAELHPPEWWHGLSGLDIFSKLVVFAGKTKASVLHRATHRWQWGTSGPASSRTDACRRCRCSSLHHGSPRGGWWLPRCLSGRGGAPRAAVRSRCLSGRAGSSAGSGSGHPASAPASGTHLDPSRHCRSDWRASPLEPPDAPEPLPCLKHITGSYRRSMYEFF